MAASPGCADGPHQVFLWGRDNFDACQDFPEQIMELELLSGQEELVTQMVSGASPAGFWEVYQLSASLSSWAWRGEMGMLWV